MRSYPAIQLTFKPEHHRHVLLIPFVLKYELFFYKKHQIGTELSYDVLNPTHVSL